MCAWPDCTGVHDNNRYAELCPRSREAKRVKDSRYEAQAAVQIHRYMLDLTARIGAKEERIAEAGAPLGIYSRTSDDAYWDHCDRFASRPKRQRPKVPTICAGRGQVISVERVLTATCKPDVRWRVL